VSKEGKVDVPLAVSRSRKVSNGDTRSFDGNAAIPEKKYY